MIYRLSFDSLSLYVRRLVWFGWDLYIFHFNKGSDDDEEEEGSTAAMDGSALRTPPADAEPIEPGSGGGSESGKSNFQP